VGHLDLAELPPGAGIVLHGLRTDPRSGRAFPATVEITGASVVRVNGIRMMNPAALPDTVDAPGVVLAAASDRSALLVRPTDAQLPDLRVVVTPTTSVVTPDSLAADIRGLSVGDSVHVRGPTERGLVVTDRLILPGAEPAPTVSEAEEIEPRERQTVRTSSPVVRRERGQGRGRGRGNGKGNKKGKG